MTIISSEKDLALTLALEGKLDGGGASDLEKYLQQINPIIVKEVIFDLSKLTYVSSMGLRAILQAYKNLTKYHKTLRLIHIPDSLRDIFEMTGFMQLLVQDEKFVVIEKIWSDSSIVYSLFGDLDLKALALLDTITEKIKKVYIKKVYLSCEKLNSISLEGCVKLRDLRDMMEKKKISLTMEHLSDPVLATMKSLGFEDLIKTVGIKRPESEKECSGTGDTG